LPSAHDCRGLSGSDSTSLAGFGKPVGDPKPASGCTASSLSSSIKTATQTVITAIDTAVIANHSGTRERGTGISINLPAAAASLAGYTASEFDLVADTHWRRFLE